jgi:hypothetical protein
MSRCRPQVLLLPMVRASRPPDGGNDLPQVCYPSPVMVLRRVPDGPNPLRHLRKATRARVGVTYKTAWRMFNKIRSMLQDDDDEPLSGTVEADETYVGGARRGTKRGRPGEDSHKTPVFPTFRTHKRAQAQLFVAACNVSLQNLAVSGCSERTLRSASSTRALYRRISAFLRVVPPPSEIEHSP